MAFNNTRTAQGARDFCLFLEIQELGWIRPHGILGQAHRRILFTSICLSGRLIKQSSQLHTIIFLSSVSMLNDLGCRSVLIVTNLSDCFKMKMRYPCATLDLKPYSLHYHLPELTNISQPSTAAKRLVYQEDGVGMSFSFDTCSQIDCHPVLPI